MRRKKKSKTAGGVKKSPLHLSVVIPLTDEVGSKVVMLLGHESGLWYFPQESCSKEDETPLETAQQAFKKHFKLHVESSLFKLEYTLKEKGLPPRYIYHLVIPKEELPWISANEQSGVRTYTEVKGGDKVSSRTARMLWYGSKNQTGVSS